MAAVDPGAPPGAPPSEPPPPAPPRRWARRLAIIAAAIVLLPIALVLVLLVAADTDAGRSLIRRYAVDFVNESVLTGRAEIDRLDGTLFGDLTIRGVRVFDASGREAIRVESIRVATDLGALIEPRVRVDAIEIVRPSITAAVEPDGSLNLARLVRPGEPKPEEEEAPREPSSLRIELARFSIEEGRFAHPASTIEHLNLALSATVAGADVTAELARLSFAIAQPALEVDASARAKISTGRIAADLSLAAGPARVKLEGLELAMPDLAARGRLSIHVPPGLLRDLKVDPGLVAGLDLDLRFSEGVDPRPWVLRGEGQLAGAALSLEGAAGLGGGAVNLSLLGIDPARIHEAAPPGRLDLRVEADAGTEVQAAKLVVSGDVDLGGERIPIASLEVNAKADPARVESEGTLSLAPPAAPPAGRSPSQTRGSAGGRDEGDGAPAPARPAGRSRSPAAPAARVDARWSASLERTPAPLLRSATFHLAAAGLERLFPRLAPVGGAIDLDARAEGPLDALAVTAKVKGSTLAYGGQLRLRRLGLDAEVRGVPAALDGSVRLDFEGLATPALRFDAGSARVLLSNVGRTIRAEVGASGPSFIKKLDLAATATESGGAVDVALERLRVETPPATWTAAPARVRRSAEGAIHVSGLEIVGSRDAGRIAVAGSIDPARFPATRDRIAVSIAGLDLDAFEGLAPAAGPLGGRLDMSAWLASASGVATASVSVAGRGLVRGAGGPADVSLGVELSGSRKIEGRLALGGADLGALVASARGRAPANPLDGAAWARDGLLEAAEGTIAQLSLGRLAAFADTGTVSRAPKIAGTLEGRFSVAERAERADLRLEARKIEAPGLTMPTDVDVEATTAPDGTALRLEARLSRGADLGARLLAVEARTPAGAGALRREGAGAVEKRGASVRVLAEELSAALIAELARLDRADPRFSEPRGTVSLAVTASIAKGSSLAKPSLADHTLNASVVARGFALRRAAPPLDLALSATVARAVADAGLEVSLGERGRAGRVEIEAAVELPREVEALGELGPRALDRLRGRIDGVDLAAARDLAGAGPAKVSGTLGLAFDLGRSLETGWAAIELDDLVSDRRFAPVDLGAALVLGRAKQSLSATVAFANSPALFATAELGGGSIMELLEKEGPIDPAITATLRSSGFRIETAFIDERMRRTLRGRLDLAAAVAGTPSRPTAHAEIALKDAVLGGTPFGSIIARLAHAPAGTHVELGAVGKGRLSVRADVQPSGAAQAEVLADAFELGFVGPLLRTLADSAVGIDGRLDGKLGVVIAAPPAKAGAARAGAPAPAQGPDAPAAAPEVSGKLTLSGVRAVYPGAPPLENGRVELSLDPKRIELDVTGKLGGGELVIDLGANHSDGFSRVDLEGTTRLRGVRVLGGSQAANVNSEIHLTVRRGGGNTNASVVIGPTEVILPKEKSRPLRAIERFEDVEYVASIEEDPLDVSSAPEIAKAAEAAEDVAKKSGGKLYATVKATEPIAITGGENDLRVGVDLAMSSEGGASRLTGSVEVEGGRLVILGKAYTFRRGLVLFDGRTPPDPRLDLELAHDFDSGVTLLLVISGTGRKPSFRFDSQPGGYDQAQLFGFFVGRGPGESGGGEGADAGAVAGGLLASQLAGAAKNALPIDTLDVDPGDGGNKGGSVGAGKWVTSDVFVSSLYRFDPQSEENQVEGILRWHFARGWTLETRFGDRSTGEVKAVWRKRF